MTSIVPRTTFEFRLVADDSAPILRRRLQSPSDQSLSDQSLSASLLARVERCLRSTSYNALYLTQIATIGAQDRAISHHTWTSGLREFRKPSLPLPFCR
jgi:hypothetical protein